MCVFKRSVLLLCVVLANMVFASAQSLTGVARRHWNKASVFIENAVTENEWQLAINELEQVVKLAPGFYESYLKLGDAYSHLSNAKAVEKAKYFWKEYEKRVPSSTTEIQDKIDRLEARYQIAILRNREKVIESLIGRWRGSKESTRDFWSDDEDMEIYLEGNKLMLKYVSMHWNTSFNDEREEHQRLRTYNEIPLDSDSIVIEYEQTGKMIDKDGGRIVDSLTVINKYKFVISQPPVDGVIKGTLLSYIPRYDVINVNNADNFRYKVD